MTCDVDNSCECHPDCGRIIARADGMHAHENVDGIFWHEDTDAE